MQADRVIVAGEVRGRVEALDMPLSFWGGFDAHTGHIIDEHHPQVGADLRGAVVVMTSGRGSSSASSVLTEAVRRNTAPAAFVMREPDEILTTGAVVAEELYGHTVPIVLVDEATFGAVAAANAVVLSADGEITTA